MPASVHALRGGPIGSHVGQNAPRVCLIPRQRHTQAWYIFGDVALRTAARDHTAARRTQGHGHSRPSRRCLWDTCTCASHRGGRDVPFRPRSIVNEKLGSVDIILPDLLLASLLGTSCHPTLARRWRRQHLHLCGRSGIRRHLALEGNASCHQTLHRGETAVGPDMRKRITGEM